jgi:hypothetical protein
MLIHQDLVPGHTPFRDDYTRKVEEDDFIVNGARLEIKTKMRKESSPFPPPPGYNVNLGKKEIEEAIHVFVELSSKVKLTDNPASRCFRSSNVFALPGENLISSIFERTPATSQTLANNRQ